MWLGLDLFRANFRNEETMLPEFVMILLFVSVLSLLIMMLGTRPAQQDVSLTENTMDQNFLQPEDMEELADLISRDTDLLKQAPSIVVPHINLPGAQLGGGAAEQACSKTIASLTFSLNEDPSERRKYNRRLQDRRDTGLPVEEDRRLIQRRIWLRREEDRKGKTLLNITDAANTVGVSIEQLYKWLDNSDIPFYQVTEGKRRAIRFEINELLQWHGKLARRHTDGGQKS